MKFFRNGYAINASFCSFFLSNLCTMGTLLGCLYVNINFQLKHPYLYLITLNNGILFIMQAVCTCTVLNQDNAYLHYPTMRSQAMQLRSTWSRQLLICFAYLHRNVPMERLKDFNTEYRN